MKAVLINLLRVLPVVMGGRLLPGTGQRGKRSMTRTVHSHPGVGCVFLLALLVVNPAHAGPNCKDLTGETGLFPYETISSGGLERSYSLYVHSRYKNSRPTPVVFDFHGLGSNAEGEYWYTQMSVLAEKFKFILVTPQGFGNSWNGGGCCNPAAAYDIADVAFVSELIDEVTKDYCINPDRVFATGISNGGFISNRLACELSDRIAAIAPVASANYTFSCAPSRPVPIIAFNGTEDVLVPYAAGVATIEDWAYRNACSAETETYYQEGDVTCIEYQGCSEGADVVYCTIDGGGHNWPGAVDIFELDPVTFWWAGYTTQDIDASRAIWKFFADHSMEGEGDDD